MLLKIENLNKNYGARCALTNIDLNIDHGCVLGILGDNGAGKSTLLKCITGAESFDSGCISFDDQSFTHMSPTKSRLSGIEMIYQNLDLCPQQDIVSNIFLGREKYLHFFGFKTPFLDKKTMENDSRILMQKLGLEVDVRTKVSSLSGGQQQRIAIARALVSQPKLLIMDEPTASLGVKETKKLLQMIKDLKNQAIAVIFVSHKIQDVMDVSDRILMMQRGKITLDLDKNEISLTTLNNIMMNEEAYN